MNKDKELLWEMYKHEIDLHKGYIDLAIKLVVFYYAITGAIVSFYFAQVEIQLIGIGLVIAFFKDCLF